MDLSGYPLGQLVSILDRTLEDHIDEGLQGVGCGDITRSQGVVMHMLDREGTRITEIAARARISVQSVSELVNALQRQGYLERRPDPADGRAKLVMLTPKGEQAVVGAMRGFDKLGRAWELTLGPERTDEFKRALIDLALATGTEHIR
ncbi:MarR family winged helix-turn-helix transcriptional regulator [Antrihabitans stalactiti]|uniref:Winged helix DNA-binding protein n=1 Tax=Antrihabitans stalactiti TaxID=2584121 RepID=A0A848KEI7_9NOCA|nr:MarR family transcriptional regulator [Antrihabitans stalactiti]NMN97235.1 winged helix DNA-binding protein [Antrihabitans stalactiti]